MRGLSRSNLFYMRSLAASWPEQAIVLSSTGFDGGFQLPLSRLLGEGVASVLRLELDWGDEADLAVQAAEVELMRVIVSTAGSRGLVVEALE